jgi:hypothetical protein
MLDSEQGFHINGVKYSDYKFQTFLLRTESDDYVNDGVSAAEIIQH